MGHSMAGSETYTEGHGEIVRILHCTLQQSNKFLFQKLFPRCPEIFLRHTDSLSESLRHRDAHLQDVQTFLVER